jgi:hypothetical protein
LVVAAAVTLLAAVPHEGRAAERHAAAAPAASAWSWSAIVERIEAQLRPVLGWATGGRLRRNPQGEAWSWRAASRRGRCRARQHPVGHVRWADGHPGLAALRKVILVGGDPYHEVLSRGARQRGFCAAMRNFPKL